MGSNSMVSSLSQLVFKFLRLFPRCLLKLYFSKPGSIVLDFSFFLVSLDVAFSPHGIVSLEVLNLLASCYSSCICRFPSEQVQIDNFVMITAAVILGTYLSVRCSGVTGLQALSLLLTLL